MLAAVVTGLPVLSVTVTGTDPAWKFAAAGTLTTTLSSVACVTVAGWPPICTAPTFSRFVPVRVTVPPETLPTAGWMDDTTDEVGVRRRRGGLGDGLRHRRRLTRARGEHEGCGGSDGGEGERATGDGERAERTHTTFGAD